MRWRRKLVTLFFLLVVGIPFWGRENIIRNGTMEVGQGNPSSWGKWGWEKRNALFLLEEGEAHGGKRFATIENKKNNDSRFIQEVLVEEGKIYRISGWIKTENVGAEGRGASISLLNTDFTSRDIKGTNGKWEYVEFYAHVDRYVMKLSISLGIGGPEAPNTGRASFDDVRMEEVSAIPGEAVAYTISGNPDEMPPPVIRSNQFSREAKENKSGGLIFVTLGIILLGVISGIVMLVRRNR